jgi:hypothetical protein
MAVRDVLLSGDPRLRQPSRAVPPSQFGGEVLLALVQDLRDTMAARDGAGLAAPQIGVSLRVVVFGVSRNPRYPQAPPIAETVSDPLGSSAQGTTAAELQNWHGRFVAAVISDPARLLNGEAEARSYKHRQSSGFTIILTTKIVTTATESDNRIWLYDAHQTAFALSP